MNCPVSGSITEVRADFRRVLRQSCVVLALCTAAVLVCYFFVDRQVATYVHEHQLNHFESVKVLTFFPPWLQTLSPAILVFAIAWLGFAPLVRCLKVLCVACISLIVADQFRTSLGDLCGRYWPETWFNNPSWIGTGTYGFHPFQFGDDTGSFPSGHAARVLGFFSVFWIALPRGRVVYALLALPMLIALVMMNYHFVSDVIAGSVLGGIVGYYAAVITGLDPKPQ